MHSETGLPLTAKLQVDEYISATEAIIADLLLIYHFSLIETGI